MFMMIFSAIWLGILTSISPCPLATNIAAVSFLSKKVEHPKLVFISGLAYTLGRVFTYMILGGLIVFSLASTPVVANFLQKYMNRLLGPILILVGLFLLGVLRFSIPSFSLSVEKQNKIAEGGVTGAFLLGVLFSLSFCPISAALFFGSLIPLALKSKYGIVLPFFYGLGTGLPVFLFAFGIAKGVVSFSHWVHKLNRIEVYTRKITGIIFLIVGIYYIGVYVLPIVVNRG
jgi:cytochrome c biogenesis protein CcdA